MAKNHRNFFLILFIGILSLQCNNNKKAKQEEARFTGLILATPDELRKVPLAMSPIGAGELPTIVDLSNDLPPAGYQGKQSSCVGWAAAYALKSYQEKVETKSTAVFSPAFIYNQINLGRENGRDGGASIIKALNLLSDEGAATLADMPYDESNFLRQPDQDIKEKAKPFRIEGWRQVNIMDIKEVKAQLNAGFPVIIAVSLDEGFKAGKPNVGNEFIWKSKIGGDAGAHAMLVVGFDNSKNAFKVINSWGNWWGNNGYCWIDYNFFPIVVKEGYIAKDAQTPNTTIDPNVINPNTTVIDNNPVINVDPSQYVKAKFENIQVLHNQNHPQFGNCMKITGIVDIPKGIGKTFQFSVHFYYSNTTTQVGSLQSPQFADVNGYAATGTILYSVPDEGLNNWAFEVFMPYTAFNIQTGSYVNGKYQSVRTSMYAIPTLFIDNFGYSKGEAIPFYVDK